METTFGQDIDAFIAEYIPEGKKELALCQLELIVLKAERAMMVESYKKFSYVIAKAEGSSPPA